MTELRIPRAESREDDLALDREREVTRRLPSRDHLELIRWADRLGPEDALDQLEA